MRWCRAVLLGIGVLVLSRLVVGATTGPVLAAWEVVRDARSPARAGPAAAPTDLPALLTGCCALALLLASTWLATAVAVCTGEALRDGAGGDRARVDPGRPQTVLRPRLVRSLVATVLGVTAVSAPLSVPLTAQARPAAHESVADGAGPVGQLATAATSGVRLRAHPLGGLPVPDRTTGRLTVTGPPDGSLRPGPVVPQLVEVRPGDSLWSLTAGLLPEDVADRTVVAGWPLLHAANRRVVGADPHLLRPGQVLRVPAALADLADAGHPDPRHPGGLR